MSKITIVIILVLSLPIAFWGGMRYKELFYTKTSWNDKEAFHLDFNSTVKDDSNLYFTTPSSSLLITFKEFKERMGLEGTYSKSYYYEYKKKNCPDSILEYRSNEPPKCRSEKDNHFELMLSNLRCDDPNKSVKDDGSKYACSILLITSK